MIYAVIVTYNRKNLLLENLNMLKKQTLFIDRILIVDNCSTDGTYEALFVNGWLGNGQLEYIKTQTNIGGAGGFYTGIKKAYESGADWIILMDDDGRAANSSTFSKLFLAATSKYQNNTADRKIFINSLVCKDDLLSFKLARMYTVNEAVESAVDGIIDGEANPFNGTLISRELVETIGFPNKDFFIKGDEVDYKERAISAGAYVGTVVDSRYIHPRPEVHEKKVFGFYVPFFVEAPWKEYYAARNFTYVYKRNKHYKAILFELIFVKTLAIFSFPCSKIKTLKMMLRGVRDGWRGKLGATVFP